MTPSIPLDAAVRTPPAAFTPTPPPTRTRPPAGAQAPHQRHAAPHEHGVALVITLLFTAMVLLIIVSTSATLVTGARSGGADERRAYQALLSAESGLNTVTVRVNERLTTTPYNGVNAAHLQAWLDGLSTQPEATLFPTLTFTAQDATHFTVRAHGSASGAVRMALQDYRLTTLAFPVNLRVRAALTSLPPIDATGSASITGHSGAGQITTLTSPGLTASIGASQVTVTVDDPSGLQTGDYVRVPAGPAGQRFRIEEVSGTQLKLVSVPGPLPAALSYPAGTGVDLLLNAAAQSAPTSDPMTLRVSNAADFTVNELVRIGGQEARVTTVTPPGSGGPGQLTLDWTSLQPGAVAEGTEITRDTRAMRSASTISVLGSKVGSYTLDDTRDCTALPKDKGPAPAPTCAGANDPLLTNGSASAADTFFTRQLFGLSDAELDDLIPLTPASAFTPMVNTVRRIRAEDFGAFLESAKNATSSGVLIVDGDINANVNGNTVFDGFIYFRGNDGGKFNGDLKVNGALAVRGGPIEGITAEDVSTNITGNLTVDFNAVKLRQRLLAARGRARAEETQGSWRLR